MLDARPITKLTKVKQVRPEMWLCLLLALGELMLFLGR